MSITIIGIIVGLVGLLFQQSGVEIAPEKIQTTVEVTAQFIGLIIAWWGRYRTGDIKWFGKRIK